jgi:DNA-binding transcriptional regulator YhcF (GntR family)
MARRGRTEVTSELRDRLVSGIHVGRLHGGDRLPPVRKLAEELEVNERVVLAALHALANEGFIELRPRSGAYVLPPHPSSGASLPHLGTWLVGTLLQARARGLSPRALSEFVQRGLSTQRVRAACVECNRDQLHLLSAELANDHGYLVDHVPLEELSAVHPPDALRRADVLVTTAFHTDRVRRAALALRKPWIAVSLRAEVMRDVGRHLNAGILYYVATDPRFERKLRRMLREVGPLANLRVMIVGRDDLGEIPPVAPTFIMTSAADCLRQSGGERCPGTPIQPPRQFSDSSARELLAFLVRANLSTLAAVGDRPS